MSTIATTREFDVFAVSAHLLAATDDAFQGRTVPTRRRIAPVTGLVASIAGPSNPAGVVLVGGTTVSRGRSMI